MIWLECLGIIAWLPDDTGRLWWKSPKRNAFILLLQEGDNMDTTITLNKAKSELRIGRDRLIKLLKDFQIEVIQRIKFLLQFLKKN